MAVRVAWLGGISPAAAETYFMKPSIFHAARIAALAGLGLLLCLASTPAKADNLGKTLDKILDIPALKGGLTGVIVQRVSDGKVLYERNADMPLSPASNRKLFTSAAAMELLGPDFTFHTDVLAAGKPDSDGVLHGDIYLRGDGDSNLSYSDMQDMAKQLVAAGVKTVDGSVIGDGSIFTDGPYPDGWEFDELPYYYAPQVEGLEVSRGVLAVHVTAGAKVGDPVNVVVDQPTKYLPIENTATTGAADSAKDSCNIWRPWNKNVLMVDGTVPLGGKANGLVTVLDPVRYASTVLSETLQREGITVTGVPGAGKTPAADATVLASHVSVPMSKYIAIMNKPSVNLLAESLIREIGAKKGKGGDYWSGHVLEMDFFKKLGCPENSIFLIDGSGLAQSDVVTPRAVAILLRGMHGQPDWTDYENSLPIAGVDGSLYARMKGTIAAGNVHAKTGNIRRVISLSGYVTSKKGDLYDFSMIMNQIPGDSNDVYAAQNKFCVALATDL